MKNKAAENSLQRIVALVIREVKLNYKSFLLSSAIIFILLGLGDVIVLYNKPNEVVSGMGPNSLSQILLIWSLIWASLSFSELISSSNKHFYLSLPASIGEKLISKVVFFLILIPLAFSVAYVIFMNLEFLVLNLGFNSRLVRSKQEWSVFLNSIPLLIIGMSCFFTGSIWQPKYSFFKTALFGFILLIATAALGFLIFRIIFYEHFDGFRIKENGLNFNINMDHYFEHSWVKYTLFSLGLFFCYSFAYFKLKEKEI